MKKTLLFVCDFEEFNLPLDFRGEVSEKSMMDMADEGLRRLLELISRHEIKMTFFATDKMTEKYRELLKRLVREGHEVGLHAIIDYKGDIKPEGIVKSLIRARERLEDKLNSKIYGFKSHKLVSLPSHILKEAGFVYDNSCHPTYVPGRYFNLFKSRKLNIEDGIINIPISVTPIFRLPFSWIWFRNLGLNYVKFCSILTLLNKEYINIYIHNWDLADMSKSRLPYFIKNNSGQKMEQFLDSFFIWTKRKGIQAETVYNYLKARMI